VSEGIEDASQRAAAAPDDGAAAFGYASALDAADREAEAIPMYRRALECGLPGELEYRARVQLGSSLRLTGQVAEAVAVHRDVSARWPDRPANRLFLALALLDAGAPREAVREAMLAALAGRAEPDMEYYRRALSGYAAGLHEDPA
jgi:cyanophycin synthetase